MRAFERDQSRAASQVQTIIATVKNNNKDAWSRKYGGKEFRFNACPTQVCIAHLTPQKSFHLRLSFSLISKDCSTVATLEPNIRTTTLVVLYRLAEVNLKHLFTDVAERAASAQNIVAVFDARTEAAALFACKMFATSCALHQIRAAVNGSL